MTFWRSFWLTNLSFAIGLFGALTCLVTWYVLIITWFSRREMKTLLRAIGFLLLSIFYGVVAASGDGSVTLPIGKVILQTGALVLIAVSYYIEPFQVAPQLEEEENKEEKHSIPLALMIPVILTSSLNAFNTFVAFLIVVRLFIKENKGMEKELTNILRGMAFLFASVLIMSLGDLQDSSLVLASRLFVDFGFGWVLVQIFQFLGFVFLAIWAWGYLRFKLVSQIVGAMVMSSLFLFVAIACSYTSLLVNFMQQKSLSSLHTNLKIFEFAVGRLKNQVLATTSVTASSQAVKEALERGDMEELSSLAQKQLVSTDMDFLAILGAGGKVLARGEDPEAVGDSMSSNFVVTLALEDNEKAVDLRVKEWINAPQVLVEAAVPVGKLGAVYAGYIVDSAFVDGVKEATGLDVTVYGEGKKSATTFISSDGVSRLVGVEEANEAVKVKVLEKGEEFLGLNKLQGSEYLSAYIPYKDIKGNVLGMMYVGYPSKILFEAAQVAMMQTFYVTAVLAVLSIIPSFLLARFIEMHQV